MLNKAIYQTLRLAQIPKPLPVIAERCLLFAVLLPFRGQQRSHPFAPVTLAASHPRPSSPIDRTAADPREGGAV